MTTNPTTTSPIPNRARAGLRGRRGSAIILVIVSIVLMAILGATFVQVARFERVSPGGEHIDIAIDSVLNEVAVVLAEDLYNDNGDFFNAFGSDGSDGGGDEPYDYPWTNGAVTNQRPVTFVDGTGGFAEGGVGDDPWLASSHITDLSNDGVTPTPAQLRWGHLSDLTGRRIDHPSRDLTTLGQNNPGEVAATANFFTNFNSANGRLVDADGDGIGDSVWCYCPAAEIDGKRYVYAIRIVDLSSRVNLNTATGQTSSTGAIPQGTTQSAHGDSPTDVDALAMGVVFGTAAGVGGGTGHGEVAQTIAQRINVLNPNWGDADQQRRHYWLNGASTVDPNLTNRANDTLYPNYDPLDTYGLSDLFELLHKHGLNNGSVTTQVETDMPNLLRAGNPTETDWSDAAGSEAIYLANNPRNQFTTASGELALAPGVTVATGDATLQTTAGERVLQADINHSDKNDLAIVIRDTVDANGTFDFTSNFAHVPNGTELGAQLAVNIIDFRDPDNQLSDIAGARYGMEALPFISEVYVQRQYTWNGNADPQGANFRMDFTATAAADYAIEIHNPFNREISLENVHLVVGNNGSVWDRLTDLDPGVPTTLAAGDYIVLFSDTTGTLSAGYLAGVPASKLVDIGATAPAWPNAGRVQVQLQAEAQTMTGAGSDTPLGWAYCAVTVNSVPANDSVVSIQTAPVGPGPEYYFQYSYQNTTGLDLVQVEPGDRDAAVSEPDTAYDTSMAEFGQTKSRFSTANLNGVWNGSVPAQQWLFLDKDTALNANDGRIPYVADVLTIPVVGPTPTNTVAEQIALSTATRLDDLMLDYRRASANVVNASFDGLDVPHAVLLMSRLTTHNPAVDGFDLNGDGSGGTVSVVDELEAFVPGKINLNTASYDVLRTALPFPSGAMRDAVARQIVEYRQDNGRLAGSRNVRGIAYVAELYEEVQPDVAATIGGGGYDPWDWNNDQNPRATSSVTYQPDNITGDREEDLMIAKWLNELGTTRSDVFVAYLVVQGYPEGNFGAGPVESARLIAVFSRANVRQVGDKAQLIAVRRVE